MTLLFCFVDGINTNTLIFYRDIVDMLSQFMIDFCFQQILILVYYIIKENTMLSLARRLQ